MRERRIFQTLSAKKIAIKGLLRLPYLGYTLEIFIGQMQFIRINVCESTVLIRGFFSQTSVVDIIISVYY